METGTMRRLKIGTIVRFDAANSRHYGRIGKVTQRFPNIRMVRVSFSNGDYRIASWNVLKPISFKLKLKIEGVNNNA